ncbi:hypothetical protein K470DRAFT_221690 [Piedraia hortae CBS 480.64]|uniref:Uncharacterized protein n=1 Tax=Piedraia hortae CBS 480.64 TaxID=1314780 RepID=A0A6A7BTD6_9PEZI|nr:hypothetical protein K470DRAFT_221690 [Piedraia hortae CBS 480.64]
MVKFLRLIFVTLSVLSTTAIADGNAIVKSTHQISKSTAKLNNTIAGWKGGVFGPVRIGIKAGGVMAHALKGAIVAKKSGKLTKDESMAVGVATLGLVQDIKNTLDSVVKAKPKFKRLLMKSIVRSSIRTAYKATKKITKAVISKVPDDLKKIAEQMVGSLHEAFLQAIAAYK